MAELDEEDELCVLLELPLSSGFSVDVCEAALVVAFDLFSFGVAATRLSGPAAAAA